MIIDLIDKVENELKTLGFNEIDINKLPPIINRINITLNMAKLVSSDNHKLTIEDKKWCEYYAQYNHMFDSSRMEKLGEMYFELIETLEKKYF